LTLAITGYKDALAIGGPLNVIDPAGEGPILVLEGMIGSVAGPDPHVARRIAGGDPFTIGGEASDRDRYLVLPIEIDVEGIVEAADEDGSAVAVDDGGGLGIRGDEESTASLCAWDGGVGL
jgi:hypothetical protein